MPTVTIGDNTGDDYSGTEDTKIVQILPTNNYGSGTVAEITRWTSTNNTHLLLSFSGLSNIDSSVTVTDATLNFYITTTTVAASVTATMHRLLRNWVEAEASWNNYSTAGGAWTTAGALSDGNDRSATVSGTPVIDTGSAYTSSSDAQLITDTQNFIDGGYSNYGWHLDSDNTVDNKYTEVVTSDGTDGQRPYLSVTYTAAGGNPWYYNAQL